MADLFSSVRFLKGIGETRAKQLASLGIETIYDLIAYFPRDYEDRTHLLAIHDLQPDTPACFKATIASPLRTAYTHAGKTVTNFSVADHTGTLHISYFNNPHLGQQLLYGETYYFYGALKADGRGGTMFNPLFEPITASPIMTRRILPLYPLTAGLSNKLLIKTIALALDTCADTLPDVLPSAVQQQYSLCSAAEAYRQIHAPDSFDQLARARRRLVFEEFFIFSTGLSLLRAQRQQKHTVPFSCTDPTPFFAALPFALTGAQQRVIGEIAADFRRDVPMNRLVQGDVGSGKTLIAAAAAYCCARSGHQTALMAPTEILAEQHAASLTPLMAQFGIQTILLTGSMRRTERAAALEAAATGSANLIIGTHALLSETLEFQDLGLVIADEQHRFGVGQRAKLASKGQNPHLLVMSATPIPRTLALILYGDLDLSIVDERPPGRHPVDTFLVGESMRHRVHTFIRKQVAAGHQVYVVCPAIEENDANSLKSAEAWADALQRTVFPDLRILLLHGRMKGAEKERVMAAFSTGEADILVCTTVIEVGVDVPNANLIVIENAERFGLSQLHQLRGRVGRGPVKSYCILFSDGQNEQTRARLKALCASNDGFQIAEEDLALRGPGDFFGARQHGLPLFKVANLCTDLDTLKQAQTACQEALDQGILNITAGQPLANRIRALFRNTEIIWN